MLIIGSTNLRVRHVVHIKEVGDPLIGHLRAPQVRHQVIQVALASDDKVGHSPASPLGQLRSTIRHGQSRGGGSSRIEFGVSADKALCSHGACSCLLYTSDAADEL